MKRPRIGDKMYAAKECCIIEMKVTGFLIEEEEKVVLIGKNEKGHTTTYLFAVSEIGRCLFYSEQALNAKEKENKRWEK